MQLRKVFAISAFTLVLPLLAAGAQNAQAPAQVQGKKAKLVKLTLQNTTTHSMDLKSGEDALTLGAGQSRQVKVPIGTKITTASATDTAPSGTVVTEVLDSMGGTTVNLR